MKKKNKIVQIMQYGELVVYALDNEGNVYMLTNFEHPQYHAYWKKLKIQPL